VTADPGASGTHDDPARTMLELRDLVIGVQAQLDEVHARLDDLERRMHEPAPPRPTFAHRVRARAGRFKRAITHRAR